VNDETKVHDTSDRPILRAAIEANADIIITGDKDFLNSGIIKPEIMTATEFLFL
jgi:predicted nucleic acid-binding protein